MSDDRPGFYTRFTILASDPADDATIKRWRTLADAQNRLVESYGDHLMASLYHSSHGDWSPDAPLCELCTWAACWRRLFLGAADWVRAKEEAERHRCQTWTEGAVDVVRHADRCSCHEVCGDDS